ncbi:MAG: DUF1501 domain-containing protein [Acidobacteriota bacterium]
MNYITNKKKQRDSSVEFCRLHPHRFRSFLDRPDISRRAFFQLAGAGLTGSFLLPRASAVTAGQVLNSGMLTQNSAKKVIFIHLTGAMSHVDTLDFKVTNGVTPDTFAPNTVNGVAWPVGLLPKLGAHLGDVALVRSVTSHALVHSLAQTWAQVGRSPVAALGDIAPNVGSIVALEKEKERTASQKFPAFVALNAAAASGQGYLNASYAPFQVTPRAGAASITNTTNSNGQTTFSTMYSRLGQYDGAMRAQAPYGADLKDMDKLYSAARDMMYNPVVDAAFTVSNADSFRYGNGTAGTNFGNALVVAKQALAADQGTRFVQINFGSWDHHQNIYAANVLPAMAQQLDNALGALIDDLKASGRFGETLIIMMGEFGRTPALSAAAGRDHYSIQSVLFAGGGVTGGKVIGATNATGSAIADFGWAGSGSGVKRTVWAEDVEATMYSALGIDWTTIRYDDPFLRGYEYVPFAKDGNYGPIKELFT